MKPRNHSELTSLPPTPTPTPEPTPPPPSLVAVVPLPATPLHLAKEHS